MGYLSCKPRSEFFTKNRASRLPKHLLAGAFCLTAVFSAPASAQQVCENAYKYFDDHSHWKRGVDDVVEPKVIREKRRQLNACVAATSNDVNKGRALSILGHLSLAEDNFQEAIQLYRRTLSAANWTTDSEIRFRVHLIAAIWESKDYRGYIREASYMLSNFGSQLGYRRELLYSRRAQAHEKLGNKKAALSDFLQSGLLDDSPFVAGSISSRRSATQQALRIMREQSWRTSCSVLDAGDFNTGNELTKLDDCLSSTNLPSIDKARAYRLQSLLYDRDKKPDASYQSLLKLMRVPTDLPTFTDLDRGDLLFKSASSNSSMMHRFLFHIIRQGNFSDLSAHIQDVESSYRTFLEKALAKGSPLNSSYSFYQRETKTRDEEIVTRFLLPSVGWLIQNGDAGLDVARGLLDSRVYRVKDPSTKARLLMSRADIHVRKQDLGQADKDFAAVLPLAIEAGLRGLGRTSQRMRALIAANQARFGDAFDLMNQYFSGLSDTWPTQPTNDLVEAQTLRADFAARAGLGDEARKHIDVLKGIYERHGQPCEPCAQIEQNIAN
ncbi:hypothetical protein SAMN04488071_0572 [Kordiimonas lacus]|uniref:Tetratricopeptide repeat-containing protein n=1 Tax=Kordiimonas lacus TaxID=637679 RepID=A0A1G6UFD3_9PROT|nr:hypothetical protein SAMN04488071_0572 [Kordiimonas lacus]